MGENPGNSHPGNEREVIPHHFASFEDEKPKTTQLLIATLIAAFAGAIVGSLLT